MRPSRPRPAVWDPAMTVQPSAAPCPAFSPQQGVGGACLLQNMQFQPADNQVPDILYALGRENICAVGKAVSPVGYGADDIALLPQTVYCLPHRSAGNRQSPGNFPRREKYVPLFCSRSDNSASFVSKRFTPPVYGDDSIEIPIRSTGVTIRCRQV